MVITQKIRQLSLLLFFLVLLPFSGAKVSAAFNENVYGKCAYGVTSSCSTHTTTSTPTGLKVTVNLTDGQTIPPSGYDVVITPLNGQGGSFSSAEVYIDGNKVATVTPTSNGTATWHWDTQKYPSGDIKIVVIDGAGNRTDMPFKVKIGSPASVPSTVQGTTNSGSGAWFGSQVADAVSGKSKQFIRALPQPVVRAFPYLLFLLILAEALLLAYQSRREVRARQKLEALAVREREIAAMKQKFTQLVSHYLRTPLTILQGGAEGFAAEASAGELGKKLSAQVKVIHDTIESIISRTGDKSMPAATGSSNESSRPKVAVGKLLAVWLPVVLIGLLALVFIYLATSINEYDASTITVITQLVVYSILVVSIYLLFRQLQLHRRRVAATQAVLESERAVQNAEDTVVSDAATNLLREKDKLAALVQELPAESQFAKFVRTGFEGLSNTVDKFVIASELKGAVSTDPYVTSSLTDMVSSATAPISTAVESKHIVIKTNDESEVASRNPRLLTLVLQTMLDNAVSHSTASGVVEVGKNDAQGTTELYVTDHGDGLTPDKIEGLFQPFNRLEDVEKFDREGLGFSLYMDKLIMAYLGGDITVESKPRELTRFTVSLPKPTGAKAV